MKLFKSLKSLFDDNSDSNSNENENYRKNYVIDASITGIPEFRETINSIIDADDVIILTSITITELERLQCLNDIQGNDANYILTLAAKNERNFECVIIDETIGIPDNCIVEYCRQNADKVILLTADRTMALKARTHNIETKYFQQTTRSHEDSEHNKLLTLYAAKKIGGKLIISLYMSNHKGLRLFSGEEQYNLGTHELHIGDNVFVATDKGNYITFANYKLLCLESENNCELIYSTRIHDQNDIKKMPRADYKSFVREFRNKKKISVN